MRALDFGVVLERSCFLPKWILMGSQEWWSRIRDLNKELVFPLVTILKYEGVKAPLETDWCHMRVWEDALHQFTSDHVFLTHSTSHTLLAGHTVAWMQVAMLQGSSTSTWTPWLICCIVWFAFLFRCVWGFDVKSYVGHRFTIGGC